MRNHEGTSRAVALLVSVFLGAAGASWSQGAPAEGVALRPNVLLLVAEDLGPRIGAFGDPVARTPNIDRLAQQGVRYPNTFTATGVCATNRASLMLGMHAISTGTQHMRASSRPEGGYVAVPPPEAKAFPELLRRAGTFTFQHGKTDYGFSDGPMSGAGPFTIWSEEDNEDLWRDREAGQPFFGMINYLVTHESGIFSPLGTWPHGATHLIMQLIHAYRASDVARAFEPVPVDPLAVSLPPYYPDLPELRADLARFYENIQVMDAEVGAILEQLENDGLADSTIVIWTTDHGDGLPRAKRELYDTGIRVPMVIRWPEKLRPPSLAPGDVDERLISFVDLAPTILGIAGLATPAHFQGRSFLDPGNPPRSYVFASRDRIDETTDRQRAVRDDRFKYIRSWVPDLPGGHPASFRENQDGLRALLRARDAGQLNEDQMRWFEPPGEERLFDLTTDPWELHDVSPDPAQRDTLERMRGAYAEWRARVPDWSEGSEAEMVERMWPGGEQPTSATPEIEISPQGIVLRCASEGASIGYRIDDGRWRVYAGPITAPDGARIEARAIRYGWQESDTAEATVRLR